MQQRLVPLPRESGACDQRRLAQREKRAHDPDNGCFPLDGDEGGHGHGREQAEHADADRDARSQASHNGDPQDPRPVDDRAAQRVPGCALLQRCRLARQNRGHAVGDREEEKADQRQRSEHYGQDRFANSEPYRRPPVDASIDIAIPQTEVRQLRVVLVDLVIERTKLIGIPRLQVVHPVGNQLTPDQGGVWRPFDTPRGRIQTFHPIDDPEFGSRVGLNQ